VRSQRKSPEKASGLEGSRTVLGIQLVEVHREALREIPPAIDRIGRGDAVRRSNCRGRPNLSLPVAERLQQVAADRPATAYSLSLCAATRFDNLEAPISIAGACGGSAVDDTIRLGLPMPDAVQRLTDRTTVLAAPRTDYLRFVATVT
jgi:hypothetical protein